MAGGVPYHRIFPIFEAVSAKCAERRDFRMRTSISGKTESVIFQNVRRLVAWIERLYANMMRRIGIFPLYGTAWCVVPKDVLHGP